MKKRNLLALFISIVLTLLFVVKEYSALNNNEIGLNVLSWIKTISGNSVELNGIENESTGILDLQTWNELLSRHVSQEGSVNYSGFIEDSLKFSSYLNELSKGPGMNWSNDEKLAYWINAYNAFTIKLIIDHYPINSIKDISDGLPMINSPWDIKFFTIGGVDFDLNTIEHAILRKTFTEPRIHFAINCASYSCPKLRNEAYQADKIEMQLEEQTTQFLNNPNKNLISNSETKLSKIFNWFESDFTQNSDAKTFVKKYNSELNEANEIKFLKYNWTLNDLK